MLAEQRVSAFASAKLMLPDIKRKCPVLADMALVNAENEPVNSSGLLCKMLPNSGGSTAEKRKLAVTSWEFPCNVQLTGIRSGISAAENGG
jgi:hypothetical protein